jgi:UDP-galactopyranose mutase
MEEEKENKKVVENEVKEEEKKDADTWYPINDDKQSRYKGEWNAKTKTWVGEFDKNKKTRTGRLY